MNNIKKRQAIHDRNGKTPAPDSGAESSDGEDCNYNPESAVPPGTPPEQPTSKRKPQKIERDTFQEESMRIKSADQTSSTANNSHEGKSVSIAIGVVLALFVCVAATFLIPSTTSSWKNCSYKELRRQHPQQHEYVWRSLTTGIENILNKRTASPGVYLFVHEGSNDVVKLVRDIAAQSSTCFGKNTQPVEMQSDDFTSKSTVNDYGYAIEKYKMKIKEGRVIVIANLNEIPAAAARALHTICDTHSPIAKDVIIFLTLVIPKIGESPVANAKDALFDLWGFKLDINELDPLITRVTDEVIALKS